MQGWISTSNPGVVWAGAAPSISRARERFVRTTGFLADQGGGAVKAVGAAGDHADLGVDRFDADVRRAVLDGSDDPPGAGQ
jgi:hypothetical protein